MKSALFIAVAAAVFICGTLGSAYAAETKPAAATTPAVSTAPASKKILIGIAPSHITIPTAPLFEHPEQWKETAAAIGLYKYYGVQAVNVKWATPLPAQKLADFANARHIQLSCEFGNFFLPLDKHDPVGAALAELKPVYDAGGTVACLSLDGPDCRLLKGIQKDPSALTLNQLAQEMVKFWKGVHAAHPDIRIGLISNYPNWDFSKDLLGRNGHNTAQSGHTTEEILNALHAALTAAGEKLDYVEIDNPANYYVETKTRAGKPHSGPKNLLAIQQWCKKNNVRFHLIINAEPRDKGAKGFHGGTLDYIRRLHADGVTPDVFIIQSWYKQPDKNLPESDPNTFTNTARDAVRLIHKLYPSSR